VSKEGNRKEGITWSKKRVKPVGKEKKKTRIGKNLKKKEEKKVKLQGTERERNLEDRASAAKMKEQSSKDGSQRGFV